MVNKILPLCILFILNSILVEAQHPAMPDSLQGFTKKNLWYQQTPETKTYIADSRTCFCCPRSRDTSKSILYVLSDIAMTKHPRQFIFDAKSITEATILKPKEAVLQFGARASHGAVLFELKEGIELFTLSDLFSYANIKNEDQGLPVCINNEFVPESSQLLADIHMIKRIKVEVGRYMIYSKQIDTAQRYLNIETIR